MCQPCPRSKVSTISPAVQRQNPSAGGAALYRALPQPDFTIPALSRPYPTSQLIWTALTLSRPFGTELGQSHADSFAPANGQDAASKQQTAASESRFSLPAP